MNSRKAQDTRIRAQDYTWNPRDEATRGVVVRRGQFIQFFMPYTEVPKLIEKLTGLLEDYHRENTEEVGP